MEFRTVAEIHQALLSKRISALELTHEFLARAKADQRNAFITVCEEEATHFARYADDALAREGVEALARMPLLGVPLAIKDNLVVERVRTTCGSRILGDYVSPYTSTAVLMALGSGAIPIGKTNLDEFGMGGSNEHSAFGPVQHPTHPGFVPGGSSGGSAVAIRSGLSVLALGSDTGGSVRLPASYCGIVGMKPTYGRVSRFGLVAFGSSLDQIGPMASTVRDAATLLRAIAGHEPRDSTSLAHAPWSDLPDPIDWKKIRVGISAESRAGLHPAVLKTLSQAEERLKKQGAKLVEVELPHLRHAVATYYLVAVAEASSNLSRFDGVRYGLRPESAENAGSLKDFYQSVRSQLGPEVKRRIMLGTFTLSSGYYDAYYRRASQVRALILQDFERAFEQVDFMIGPVAPTPAYKIGEKASDPLQMYLNDLFTVPQNLAGLPAISVPLGQDDQGLPIGIQMTGPQLSDEKLLAFAEVFAS